MLRAYLSSTSVVSTRESIAAPWTAHACAVLLGVIGLVRLVMLGSPDGLTLIGLAVLIEFLVRTEARMLEDGGYFEDGVFGYDFSEGYTSLESGAPKVRPYRESALKRWRRRRSELRRQRRIAPRGGRREADGRDPRKAAPRGAQRLDRRRASVPRSRQHPLSQPDQKHVIEPIRTARSTLSVPRAASAADCDRTVGRSEDGSIERSAAGPGRRHGHAARGAGLDLRSDDPASGT